MQVEDYPFGTLLKNGAKVIAHKRLGTISPDEGDYGTVLAVVEYPEINGRPAFTEYVVWGTLRYGDGECFSGAYHGSNLLAAVKDYYERID